MKFTTIPPSDEPIFIEAEINEGGDCRILANDVIVGWLNNKGQFVRNASDTRDLKAMGFAMTGMGIEVK